MMKIVTFSYPVGAIEVEKKCVEVRKKQALHLLLEPGLTYAELVALLAISESAVSKIVKASGASTV